MGRSRASLKVSPGQSRFRNRHLCHSHFPNCDTYSTIRHRKANNNIPFNSYHVIIITDNTYFIMQLIKILPRFRRIRSKYVKKYCNIIEPQEIENPLVLALEEPVSIRNSFRKWEQVETALSLYRIDHYLLSKM